MFALPNNLAGGIINGHEVRGKILLVERDKDPYDRDKVELLSLIKEAQNWGATGIIIIDHERPKHTTKSDIDFLHHHEKRPILQSIMTDGFSRRLDEITIPAVIISYEGGKRLKDSLELIKIDLPGWEKMQYCIKGSFFEKFGEPLTDELKDEL